MANASFVAHPPLLGLRGKFIHRLTTFGIPARISSSRRRAKTGSSTVCERCSSSTISMRWVYSFVDRKAASWRRDSTVAAISLSPGSIARQPAMSVIQTWKIERVVQRHASAGQLFGSMRDMGLLDIKYTFIFYIYKAWDCALDAHSSPLPSGGCHDKHSAEHLPQLFPSSPAVDTATARRLRYEPLIPPEPGRTLLRQTPCRALQLTGRIWLSHRLLMMGIRPSFR